VNSFHPGQSSRQMIIMDSRQTRRDPRKHFLFDDGGLDFIEFQTALEGAFPLNLTEECYAFTVGELKRHIQSRLPAMPAASCATQKAFYQIRRKVSGALHVRRSRIRPDTSWVTLLFLGWQRIWMALWLVARRVPGVRTVGDAARLEAGLHARPHRLKPRWTREQVSLTVDRLIFEKLQVWGFDDEDFLVQH
jgi:hypothetical protein